MTNPTVNPFHPSADPRDELAFCEQALRNDRWFEKAGLAERWPVATAEAVKLLADGGEYDVDEERLEDLVRRRIITAPAKDEDGAAEWSAGDLVRAGGILECRGQWQPTPSGHDPKKHPTRLFLEQARSRGELASVAHSGPVDYDVRHLIQLLVLCNVPEGRMKVAALLEAVLEVEHEVVL